MNQIKTIPFTLADASLLWQSTIGLEREALRLDYEGRISQHLHSKKWGTRNHQPYIQTDFAESQIEFITPPVKQPDEILDWFSANHQIIQTQLEETEYQELIWPFSMPGHIGDPDLIKVAQLSNKKEFEYREHLVDIYGKHVQLVSGIHYNYQIDSQLVQCKLDINQLEGSDRINVINETYMYLARKYIYFRWVLTYLLGASPYVDPDYHTKLYGSLSQQPMRTIRQSRYGYQNDQAIHVSYSSLAQFVEDIETAVSNNQLSQEKELYRDVRIRGRKPSRRMLEEGIQYLEFRNFDLNPYEPYGISIEDIHFIKLWLIALTIYSEEDFDDQEIVLANQRNRATAEDHPLSPLIDPQALDNFWSHLKEVANVIDTYGISSYNYTQLVEKKEAILHNPQASLVGRILSDCPDPQDFLSFGLDLARQHRMVYLAEPYTLHGFQEMELSSQDVLKQAMRVGLKIDLLDRQDNLFKLSYNDHQELIKNGNQTNHDGQATFFLVDNKMATKKILKQEGLSVPEGRTFNQVDLALNYIENRKNRGLVIKPLNTNYGLGISIFKEPVETNLYRRALEEALEYDSTIMVEDYLIGTELRFYVQDGNVLAICERQPASIIGDGISTISQLIDQENLNPLRGSHHRTPLTLIEKGELETLQLKQSSRDFDTIPQKDELVFLRANSNISTGGKSIDRTDQVHQDYLEAAVRASQAMKAKISGIDMIIKDYTLPAETPNSYGIIEANYNPMMVLHLFPSQGQARDLSNQLIAYLFSEIDRDMIFK